MKKFTALKKRLERLHTVSFTSTTVLEGKLYFAAGLLLALFTAIVCMLGSPSLLTVSLLLSVASLSIMGLGLYLWKFRHGPRTYKLTLGGRDNSLYLRNRWLFVAHGVAVYTVASTIVTCGCIVLGLVLGLGGDGLHELFFAVPLAVIYNVATEWMKFHLYYRSEEYRATSGGKRD